MERATIREPIGLGAMRRIAEPVVGSLARRELKERMPVEASEGGRAEYTHLEANRPHACRHRAAGSNLGKGRGGRSAASFHGRARSRSHRRRDGSRSPDFLNFDKGLQPIVDAAFLAQGIVRAPGELWERL